MSDSENEIPREVEEPKPETKEKGKKKRRKKKLQGRNWLACIAGLAIYASFILPWSPEANGLQTIWQSKPKDQRIIQLYHNPGWDTVKFSLHALFVIVFTVIVCVEYWREKAGVISSMFYAICGGGMVLILCVSHYDKMTTSEIGFWLAVVGSGLTLFSGIHRMRRT